MQTLSGWVAWSSGPLLRLLDLLHSWTGSYLYALILLAALVRLVELTMLFALPGVRQSKKIIEAQAELERHRRFLQPDEYSAQRARLDGRRPSRPLVVLTLALIAVRASLQWYSLLALYGGLLTSAALRGQPFAWTADITSRDPRHLLSLLVLVLGVGGFVARYRRHRRDASMPWNAAGQVINVLISVAAAELLLPAFVLYGAFLGVAESLLPVVLAVLVAPILWGARKLGLRQNL